MYTIHINKYLLGHLQIYFIFFVVRFPQMDSIATTISKVNPISGDYLNLMFKTTLYAWWYGRPEHIFATRQNRLPIEISESRLQPGIRGIYSLWISKIPVRSGIPSAPTTSHYILYISCVVAYNYNVMSS